MAALPEQQDRTNRSAIVMRVLALLTVAVSLVFFFALARPAGPHAQAQSTKTTTQQTVIGRDCLQCHRAIVQSFALDAHGKSAKFLKDLTRCEV